MNHDEKRVWLIEKLLEERMEYDNDIPDDEEEQKKLLRGLMNVRMPGPLKEEILKIQDEYMSEENKRRGIINLDMLQPTRADSQLYLWKGDITLLVVDAIVNAANSQMLGCFIPGHNCIDNCIHTFSGMQLRNECNRQMNELREKYGSGYEQPTSVPLISDAYNLPAKKVIHVAGPIVDGQLNEEHEKLLANCYSSCLDLAKENGLNSIAFCCISTGVFMFPNQRAAEIAVETVRIWLEKPGNEMKIIFNVFKDEDLLIYKNILE